jgi:hypothetical protein
MWVVTNSQKHKQASQVGARGIKKRDGKTPQEHQ